eukprot:COSAG04_NODE_353_length_16071_cov_8.722514_17_plen_106_part_00
MAVQVWHINKNEGRIGAQAPKGAAMDYRRKKSDVTAFYFPKAKLAPVLPVDFASIDAGLCTGGQASRIAHLAASCAANVLPPLPPADGARCVRPTFAQLNPTRHQ